MLELHQRLIKLKKTLALAESCTGGKMAAELTAIPGASAYFLGSLVVYADRLKRELLQVPEELLKQKGAVSQEVVQAMLQGLLTITGADYGIAVSGIAGPSGGSCEKPVGTVWAAIGARGEKPHLFTFQAKGANREEIILYTTRHLLQSLYQLLI